MGIFLLILPVLLEQNLHGHPLARLLWERQFEKHWWNLVGEKCQFGNALSLTENIFSVYVDAPNGNANQTRKLLGNARRCLNPVFLLEQPKNYRDGTNLAQKTSAWSYDMEGHARKCVNCTRCPVHVKGRVGKKWIARSLLPHCIKKNLYLARIGRPDILWSVNKLARSVTKWTQACERRLARLFPTFITQVITANIVLWTKRFIIVDWGYFKIQLSREILKTQN